MRSTTSLAYYADGRDLLPLLVCQSDGSAGSSKASPMMMPHPASGLSVGLG